MQGFKLQQFQQAIQTFNYQVPSTEKWILEINLQGLENIASQLCKINFKLLLCKLVIQGINQLPDNIQLQDDIVQPSISKDTFMGCSNISIKSTKQSTYQSTQQTLKPERNIIDSIVPDELVINNQCGLGYIPHKPEIKVEKSKLFSSKIYFKKDTIDTSQKDHIIQPNTIIKITEEDMY